MSRASVDSPVLYCNACGAPMSLQALGVTMWSGTRLVLIENVPAHICVGCGEQYYDEATSEGIRVLASSGFPPEEATHELRVPVFSLPAMKRGNSRIRIDDATVDAAREDSTP